MGGLNWIVRSRLRFNSVCKFWRSVIQSSLFADLYTNTNFKFKSSSSKLRKFKKFKKFKSSLDSSSRLRNFKFKSSSSKFGDFLFYVSVPSCFQGLHESTILRLSPEFESRSKDTFGSYTSRSGSWCWSTVKWNIWTPLDAYFAAQNVAHKIKYGKYNYAYAEEKLFKVFSNQHQRHLVFKLFHSWTPSCYRFLMHPKYIVGSCNGLICLFDREQMDISIWNPATEHFRILPKWIPIENVETERFREVRHYLVALGFDVEAEDHKVVVVIWSSPRPSSQECVCRVQIYNFSTDSWRLLEDINSLPGTPINHHDQALYHSVYLNGSCFFIANVYPTQPMFGRFIISFEFRKEIFTTMPLPNHDEKQELFLSSLGEKLALFSVCHQSPIVYPMGLMVQDYDIWVMYKLGGSGSNVNKKSWKKLHSFQTITEGECTIPIGISNDGEFALLELRGRDGLSKKMQLYDLVTKEVKNDFLYCSAVWSKAIVYEPSLVTLW